jgi:hypothetical protein
LPTEDIEPFVMKINGNSVERLDFNAITSAGYRIYKSIDGLFNKVALNETNLKTPCENVNSQLVYYLYKVGVNPVNPIG